ncbi:unnamed protein product [Paramecium sonneborni]|uniref:Uncharacterized protein n=1 Tax=Paramecium sonneborni TaxID=65129 RepID=A0A8S1QZ03_9CILI|nr:unnamed protein product [Paramecium sonneborni]
MDHESNSEIFYSNFEQKPEIPFDQFIEFQPSDNNNQKNNSGASEIETQKINKKKSENNYKNFPKLIGNNFVKWIKKQKKCQGVIGIQKLIKQRKESKQANFKIKDLQELCSDEASKQVFQEFVLDELFLNLINSNKIEDSFSYVAGISNYYSAAQEPEKMKSNYLTRQLFTDLLNNTH